MNIEEALQVADKSTDRNTPARDHPSLVKMIYALEILADGHRTYREKATAWEETAGRLGREVRAANKELDRTQGHWSDLMTFIRAGLGITDDRALDTPAEVRRLLGQAIADARMWARVKDLVAGNFVAGDVVTADALNALGEAVKAGRKTGMGDAPPVPRRFRVDADEPHVGVRHVRWADHVNPMAAFTRVGCLVDGRSLWREDDEDEGSALWLWSQLVRDHPAVEIL